MRIKECWGLECLAGGCKSLAINTWNHTNFNVIFTIRLYEIGRIWIYVARVKSKDTTHDHKPVCTHKNIVSWFVGFYENFFIHCCRTALISLRKTSAIFYLRLIFVTLKVVLRWFNLIWCTNKNVRYRHMIHGMGANFYFPAFSSIRLKINVSTNIDSFRLISVIDICLQQTKRIGNPFMHDMFCINPTKNKS